MRRSPVLCAALGAFAALTLSSSALPAGASTPPAFSLSFGPPVLVSPAAASAWEPTMVIDRLGNIFITARKDTRSQILVAPDDRSPTQTRSMSWLWASSDGGRSFGNMPGLPLDAESHEWGYEGDIALDDAGHLYFVDQTYADSTISRWSVRGLGDYALDFHRPFLPTAQPVEDRPWLAAHGDGSVVYIVNNGDAALNPVSEQEGQAMGRGRFSMYRSTDGARSFDLRGRTLRDSGACRPAADHRRGSRMMYIVCTDDGGSHELTTTPQGRGNLLAYVSADDGATWTRHRIGDYNADAETFDWPLVTVASNGDVWAMHTGADEVEGEGESVRIVTNRVMLYRSTDGGRTWTAQDATPRRGRYRWGWLAASGDGAVAAAVHHRAGDSDPWRVHASAFSPGTKPVFTSVDEPNPVYGAERPEPPSEMIGLAFAPDGSLAVSWTRAETINGLAGFRVYFARSLPRRAPAPPARKPVVAGVKREAELPATGARSSAVPGATALAVAAALAACTSRRRLAEHHATNSG